MTTSNLFAILFWCATVYTQLHVIFSTDMTSICVASSDSECTVFETDRNISQLSEIPAHYENESDIVIYLMQGIHYLNESLDVGNQANHTELHGVNYSAEQ